MKVLHYFLLRGWLGTTMQQAVNLLQTNLLTRICLRGSAYEDL
jgi:hypothetical protein